MVVKLSVLEKEWNTGVSWPTAGPMSQPWLYPEMSAPLVEQASQSCTMHALFPYGQSCILSYVMH